MSPANSARTRRLASYVLRPFIPCGVYATTATRKLTLLAPAHYSQRLSMGVSKIQIGQLWKKDGTRDIYLVTRLYTEALSTMVVMRKSGSEAEALIRVKAERNSTGHNIPGFSPAQEEEKL